MQNCVFFVRISTIDDDEMKLLWRDWAGGNFLVGELEKSKKKESLYVEVEWKPATVTDTVYAEGWR